MFLIDPLSRVPVYLQIIEAFKNEVITGEIEADGQIPSVRELSMLLNTNPNTIQKAYGELDRQGLIYSAPGKGSFLSADAKDRILRERKDEEMKKILDAVGRLSGIGISKEEIIEEIKRGEKI